MAISSSLEAMLRPSVLHFCEGDAHVRDAGYPDEGVPSRQTSIEAVTMAVRDVILPGFASAGIDTTLAKRWFDREFKHV